MRKLFISLIAGFAFSATANAAVIWDNGASNPANLGANFSEGVFRIADDFTLASGETLRSTQFWGVHWSSGVEPATEVFTTNVYADAAGSVGALIGSSALSLVSKVDTGFDHNNVLGANILEFTMDFVTPIALGAGTYWLSIFSADNPGTSFAWQETGLDGSGNFQASTNQGSTWSARSNALAFNISNTPASAVPEPGTLALIGLGLGAIALRRRRKA